MRVRPHRLALVLVLAAALAGCQGSVSFGDDGGETVAPTGAPYTYVVPEGFSKAGELAVAHESGTSRFLTGVSLDPTDLLMVTVYDLTADASGFTEADLRAVLESAFAAAGVGARAAGTAPTGAGEALVYAVDAGETPTGEAVTAFLYYVFRGRQELQVTCQWSEEAQADAIRKGCDALLESLTFTPQDT